MDNKKCRFLVKSHHSLKKNALKKMKKQLPLLLLFQAWIIRQIKNRKIETKSILRFN